MTKRFGNRGTALSGLILLAFLVSTGCQRELEEYRAPVAYVGPYEVQLYDQLGPQAQVSGNLAHGQPLRVLGRHRVFVKVQSDDGRQGWVETSQLLSSGQMEDLRDLATYAQQLSSHGAATVYDELNVHTEPYRDAPSFYRLRSDDRADVVAHLLMPRLSYPREGLARKSVQPSSPQGLLTPLAVSASFTDSVDWLAYYQEISRQRGPVDRSRTEDWTLIRLDDGRAGWVLSRFLTMAIPEEVAQYSGGQEITSYFSLGTAADSRSHWLWTTRSASRQDFEFDSFRVFYWNSRKGRYETARLMRGLKGYYPVQVDPPAAGSPAAFHLLLESGGILERVSYEFQGARVTETGREVIELDPEHPPEAGRLSVSGRRAPWWEKWGRKLTAMWQ